jgi:flagellar biogenesis protein FliO
MFSNAMIAFLAAVGAGTWIFVKMQRQTGNNTSNSLVVAGGAGLVIFLIIIVALGIFFK